MGREAIPPGSYGEIRVRQVTGGWLARAWYRHHDGKYHDVRRRRSTKEAARNAVRDAISEIMQDTPGARMNANTWFREAADMWFTQYQADADNGIYSLGSVDTYRDHLRNHVLPALGSLRLREVTTPVVNRLCQDKLRRYSLSLANHTRAVTSNVLGMAVQEGALSANPVHEIAPLTARRAKHKAKKARALTEDELLTLLGKLDTDDEAVRRDLPDLVRFFVATGERRGEALGAHWEDLDEDGEQLVMSGNLVQVRGRGAVRNGGKSDAADRMISLPTWCVQMLRDRREQLGEVNPAAPIFANTEGGYWNASNLNNRHWLPFRKRAGFEWVTFHTLRKTVATVLDGAGLSAREIADVLGHAHPSMTLNVYMGRGQISRASAEALDRFGG